MNKTPSSSSNVCLSAANVNHSETGISSSSKLTHFLLVVNHLECCISVEFLPNLGIKRRETRFRSHISLLQFISYKLSSPSHLCFFCNSIHTVLQLQEQHALVPTSDQ